MNVIRQVFEGIKDKELVHQRFVRFGKGEYERFLVTVINGKNLRVKTSFDFSNDLFELIAENAKGEITLAGKLICNYDFEKELPCEASKFSKRGKLYTAEFNTTVKPEVLKEIYNKFKLQFILLNVKSDSYSLKCGKSLPKPGGRLKDNFCSATLPSSLVDEFAFITGKNFKEAKIKHMLSIKEVEIPKEYLNDPAKARVYGIRKGTIKSVAEIDGKTLEKETTLAV